MDPERLKRAIERVILLPRRMQHRAQSQKKHRVRRAAIATVRRTLAGAKSLNARSVAAVYNVTLYLLLLDQDLADFTDDMVGATGDQRRRFVAKHEAVLLYEAADDLPHLLGRDFRAAVAALGANDLQQKRLNDCSSLLSHFWRMHRNFLGEIRQALAAHREHDALTYVEKLDALEPLEVMRLSAELSGHLQRLIAVLTELAGLTVGLPALISDMKRSLPRPTKPSR